MTMATRAVRRRRSRPHLTPGTLITAASAAVACAALTSTHVLIWALITALVATVAYTLGRLHNQPPPRRARTEFARRNRAAQRPGRAPGLPRSIRPPAPAPHHSRAHTRMRRRHARDMPAHRRLPVPLRPRQSADRRLERRRIRPHPRKRCPHDRDRSPSLSRSGPSAPPRTPAAGALPRSGRPAATTTAANAAAPTATVSPPPSAQTGSGTAPVQTPATPEGSSMIPPWYSEPNEKIKCSECDGKGTYLIFFWCKECGGKGYREIPRKWWQW